MRECLDPWQDPEPGLAEVDEDLGEYATYPSLHRNQFLLQQDVPPPWSTRHFLEPQPRLPDRPLFVHPQTDEFGQATFAWQRDATLHHKYLPSI